MEELTLDEYQRQAARTDLERNSSDPTVPLLGLSGEVGSLLSEFKKKRRPDGVAYTGFEEALGTELGDILWYLACVARRAGLSLNEIATRNLGKTRDRWLPARHAPGHPFLDPTLPEGERLPERFQMRFESFDGSRGIRAARVFLDDEVVGDPIDDNARTSDHYRFHDAFHLAYLVVLGWSPILRSLLRRKRKSSPAVDRVEDGARACATEEGIAAMVFELSKPYDFFEAAERVDDAILGAVTALGAGYEVSDRTAAEWEKAILEGFELWRWLRDEDGGTVRVDLRKRVMEY